MEIKEFDNYGDALAYWEKVGGVIKYGTHYGVGIYDYVVEPKEFEGAVLCYQEWQKACAMMRDEDIPSYACARQVCLAVWQARAKEQS